MRAAIEQMNIANAHRTALAVKKDEQTLWRQLYSESERQKEILENHSLNSNESDFYPLGILRQKDSSQDITSQGFRFVHL